MIKFFKKKEIEFTQKGYELSDLPLPKISAPDAPILNDLKLFERTSVDTPKDNKKNKKEKIKKEKAPKKPKTKLKKFFIFLFYTFLITLTISLILLYFYVYIPLKKIQASANDIKQNMSSLATELSQKDITNLEARMKKISEEVEKVKIEVDKYSFLQNLSITKGYYQNLLITQNVLDKSNILISEFIPKIKDVLFLTGFKDSNNILSVENEKEPLELILGELPRYISLYQELEPGIIDVFNEMLKIDTAYLSIGPVGIQNLGVGDVEEKKQAFSNLILELPSNSKKVIDFLTYAPDLLGFNGPASYLLILQNEAEMRSGGGILTAFGNMTLENGELVGDISLKDTWNLEIYLSEVLKVYSGPENFSYSKSYPPYVSPWGYYQNIYGQLHMMNLGCGATYLRAQDTNMYPDLVWNADIFTDYYDRAKQYNSAEYPDYKYVVTLNRTFVESVISLIEPLEVEGLGVVNGNNLFEFIKQESDKKDLAFSGDRKKIIQDLANLVQKKFLELDISNFPRMSNILINSVYAKDVALYSPKNTNIQSFFDKYNLAGRMETNIDPNFDYLHINEAQNCALKLNLYVRDNVNMNVNIADDGRVSTGIKINWWQPQIYDSGNPNFGKYYSAGESHSYRAWIRLFTPLGTTDSNPYTQNYSSDGYARSQYVRYNPVEYTDNVMNKDVSDNIIRFDHRRFSESDPVRTQELNISYALPVNINYLEDGSYNLVLQKHPGKPFGEEYTVNIAYKGSTYSIKVNLDRDKIVTFKEGVITVANLNQSLDWVKEIVEQIPFDKI